MTSDITDLDNIKATTAEAMAAAGITWKIEPLWLTTPDPQSPNNQLRIYSGRMVSATKSEQIDAVSEAIFWFQARRLAQDWHQADA